MTAYTVGNTADSHDDGEYNASLGMLDPLWYSSECYKHGCVCVQDLWGTLLGTKRFTHIEKVMKDALEAL